MTRAAPTASASAQRTARRLLADERLAWRAAIDTWMELPDGHDVCTTFPLLRANRAEARAWGVFDDDRLVAHAAACSVTLRPGPGTASTTASLIGTVACAPSHRGRGLASAVLAAAVADETAAGSGWAMLWSEERDLYARQGFEPVGTEFDLFLDRATLAAAGVAARDRATLRPALLGDLRAISDLHAAKPQGVVRDPGQWRDALACRGLEAFVHTTENGRLLAYALRGKGGDFAGWCHELGGDDLAVFGLLADLAAAEPEGTPMPVVVPPYRVALLERLQPVAVAGDTRPAALALRLADGAPALGHAFFVDGLDSV